MIFMFPEVVATDRYKPKLMTRVSLHIHLLYVYIYIYYILHIECMHICMSHISHNLLLGLHERWPCLGCHATSQVQLDGPASKRWFLLNPWCNKTIYIIPIPLRKKTQEQIQFISFQKRSGILSTHPCAKEIAISGNLKLNPATVADLIGNCWQIGFMPIVRSQPPAHSFLRSSTHHSERRTCH